MGETPLYLASSEGRVSVCELLLKSGADLEKANKVYDMLHSVAAFAFDKPSWTITIRHEMVTARSCPKLKYLVSDNRRPLFF